MRIHSIRFCWRKAKDESSPWRAGLFRLIPRPQAGASGKTTALPQYWKKYLAYDLELKLTGLLAWGSGLGLAIYMTGAALYLVRLDSRYPGHPIRYSDLILPSRWSQLPALRGQAMIQQGFERYEAKDYAQALALLRAGLARYPEDDEARALLVKFYMALRVRDPITQTIRGAFQARLPNRKFMILAFAVLADAQQNEEWVELARLARNRSIGETDQRWAHEQVLDALMTADRPEEALKEIQEHPKLLVGEPLHRWRIRLFTSAGQTQEALAAAMRWIQEAPNDTDALRWLVRAARATNQTEIMDETLTKLRIIEIGSATPLLFALDEHLAAGRQQEATEALETLLLRHGASEELYPSLAQLLAKAEADAFIDLVAKELTELGYPLRPVHWAKLERAERQRDWHGVLAHVAAIRSGPGPQLTETQQAWLQTVERLANACLDSSLGTQSSLIESISANPGTLAFYRRILESLLQAQRIGTASAVLTLAEGPYPRSPSLMELRKKIQTAADLELEATPVSQNTGPERRWPDADAFLRDLQALPADTPHAEVVKLISQARRARVPGLAAKSDLIDAVELPAVSRSNDPLRLQFLARQILSRSTLSAHTLRELAKSLLQEQHPAEARILLTELVRHDPGDGEAAALLNPETAVPMSATPTSK